VLLNAENGKTSVSQDIGVRGGPLLPSLYDLLKGSGYMTEDYLLSVSRRTEQIAQVLRMLLSSNAEDISMRLPAWTSISGEIFDRGFVSSIEKYSMK
jgi:hypothetical protein